MGKFFFVRLHGYSSRHSRNKHIKASRASVAQHKNSEPWPQYTFADVRMTCLVETPSSLNRLHGGPSKNPKLCATQVHSYPKPYTLNPKP